jgi:stress response protein SCP2
MGKKDKTDMKSLGKGQKYRLLNGHKFEFGIGWTGLCGGDLDASAIVYDSQGICLGLTSFDSKYQGVTTSGDNMTGDGDGDDETITIDFNSVPAQASTIFLTISVYCVAPCNTFMTVPGTHVNIYRTEDMYGDISKGVATFNAIEWWRAFISPSNHVIVGAINRCADGQWEFEALGWPQTHFICACSASCLKDRSFALPFYARSFAKSQEGATGSSVDDMTGVSVVSGGGTAAAQVQLMNDRGTA